MDLKEILVKLKLNEDGQIDESVVQDIEKYISEAVDLKAKDMAHSMTKEIVEPIVEEQKAELVKEYEEKFEDYKKMITERFSDFVDSVLDEELEIPDNIKEYARIGELYSNWINDFKKIAGIDEGAADEEAQNIIKEARDEITKLEEELNEKEAKILELKESGREIAAELYLRQKCDGLTESQRERALNLLEGISDRKIIDEKFEKIREILFNDELNEKKNSVAEDNNENKDNIKETICICPKCGKETTVTEGSCNLYNCPDCEDTKLIEKNEKEQKTTEVKENKETKLTGFSYLLNEYVDILKNKKI